MHLTGQHGTHPARPPAGRPGAGWLLLDAAVVALAWTATAGLLGGRLRLDPALRRPRDLGQLLLVAAAAAPLLAALARVALAVAAGLVPWTSAPAALASWWARDAAGVALAAPLLAALVVRRVRSPAAGEPLWRPVRDRVETAAQALAVVLPPLLGLWLPVMQRPPLLAACFAPLVWVALRRGLAGAAAAAMATGLLLAGTLALRQPADAAGAVADLQSFLLVAAGAALWIGALADARGAGQAERGQLEAVLDATRTASPRSTGPGACSSSTRPAAACSASASASPSPAAASATSSPSSPPASRPRPTSGRP